MNIEIEPIINAAKAGGYIINKYFGEVLATEEKSSLGDLRTKADIESENEIIKNLKNSFPSFNIYAEESGLETKASEYTFVIDPLDGTNNFVLGIPDFAVSIGLIRGAETIAGVIYNPILDQLYHAEKGKGAFLNGVPIHVNHEADIKKATVSYTCGYNTDKTFSESVTSKLKQMGIKRLIDHWAPAYDYCLLASGRIEIVISKEGDLEDYLAAKLIVEEAGGKVTDFSNNRSKSRDADFVVSNGTAVHAMILELLR